MNRDENKRFIALVKGLFPTLTREQIELIGAKAMPFEFRAAIAVARTHRAQHEFLDFPQFFEGLRADAARRAARAAASRRERIVDGLRRLARTQWGIADYESLNDQSVIIEHYGKCWSSLSASDIEDLGKRSMRAVMYEAARTALTEIGLPDDEAEALAREIVGVGPGERIMGGAVAAVSDSLAIAAAGDRAA